MDIHRMSLLLLGLLCSIHVIYSFNLTIVHTNDIHAHYEQTNVHLGSCTAKQAADHQCYGGYARLVTKVKEFRALKPHNTIVIDAGDQYQGTPWFYYFGGNVSAEFVNWLDYDVMALGNHEFDRGVPGLLPFLEQVKLPILSANIDATEEPTMRGLFNKTTVLQVGGEKIGIIGYTTVDTPSISDTGKLIFNPIIPAVRAEVDKLKKIGINKIIALGHAGYQFDQQLAKEVDGLDIVVGGHSHTFLYSGTQPSTEKPLGPYPTVVDQASGAQVPVVQAYCYSKYIGHIELEFDDTGKVLRWEGKPILLDKNTEQDSATLEKMEPWEAAINASSLKVIGSTAVFLQGDEHDCRQVECSMGNVYTDAMIHKFQSLDKLNENQWATVAIAITNGGGIRTAVDVGDITMKDVLSVLPFRNEVDRIKLKGEYLLQTLEHSVSRYPKKASDDLFGGFLQMSGVIVTYDVSQPVGNRVMDVQVRCANCSVPVFEPLDKETMYTIALPMFTANGGDGYTMIKEHMKKLPPTNTLDSTILVDYLKKFSPLTQGLEGRIRFLSSKTSNDTHTEIIGTTDVLLKGDNYECIKTECNLGNVYTDAMLYAFNPPVEISTDVWTTVAVAIASGGRFHSHINAGHIMRTDVTRVFPDRDEIEVISLKGDYLLQALEHSVSEKQDDGGFPGFLQVSGLTVTYDVSKPIGNRVVDVQVRCSNCSVPVFEPLDKDRDYHIALPTSLANGSDGYTVIRDNKIDLPHIETDTEDTEVFMKYVQQFSPLRHGVEGRIRFATPKEKPQTPNPNCNVNAASSLTSFSYLPLLIALIVPQCRHA